MAADDPLDPIDPFDPEDLGLDPEDLEVDPDDRVFRPRIRSQAGLEQLWRVLLEPLGFAGHSVWLMAIDRTGRPVPELLEVADVGRAPGPRSTPLLAAFVRDQVARLAPGGRAALLRSRPGGGRAGPDDLAWASVLHAACAAAGVPAEVVHLATDEDVRPVPLDALLAPPA